MSKPNIWVDADGVLCNFGEAYLSLLCEVTGRAHRPDEVTDFDFSKCVASKAEDELVWRMLDKRPGLVRSLRWIDGACDGLAALREFGNVRCLTSPHIGPHWMYERAQWLMNRAGFKKKEIVFCSDKPLIDGDMLIEDNLETANAWDASTGGYSVLLDAPYNQGQERGFRADSWAAIVGYAREVFT